MFCDLHVSLNKTFVGVNRIVEFVLFICIFTIACEMLHNIQSIIFMPPKELWEAYSYHTVHLSVRLSRFMSGAYLLYSLM